ncbi:MAG: hypothetical protein ACR2MA_00595 [Egibacteraceae bacterium]
MDFSWLTLGAAFGGGLFGAAMGGLPAFVFTGLTVLIGVALALAGVEYDFLGNVAFGPVFGPHISFAGGAAAAAYAYWRNELEDGADIVTPLAGLATADVLLVGGVFGVGGYLLQVLLTPLVGSYLDVIAFIVFISDLIARLIFGKTGPFGKVPENSSHGLFTPGENSAWVEFQQGWLQSGVIGLGTGLFSSYIAITILQFNPDLGGAATVAGFGISAATLVFLALGLDFPVTHHMTISAAYVAVATNNLLLGTLAGIAGALVGEVFSRVFYVHGDTHVDPPAGAIAVMSLFGLIPLALA